MDLVEAYRVARGIMDRWGLKDWKLRASGSYWTPAQTWRSGKWAGSIELSDRYLFANPRWKVEQIVLHEVAHALTIGWHDEAWRAMARRIGCLYTEPKVPGLVLPPMPWWVVCGGCRVKVPRVRRARPGARCPKCKTLLMSERSGG